MKLNYIASLSLSAFFLTDVATAQRSRAPTAAPEADVSEAPTDWPTRSPPRQSGAPSPAPVDPFTSSPTESPLSDGALSQPPSLSSSGQVLEVDLEIARGSHSTVAATRFNTRFLGGSLPGPTMRVKPGQMVYVNFDNNLPPQSNPNTDPLDYAYPDSTNLHWHGAHVSGEAPGDDTSIIVDPGESYRYEVFFPQYHVGGKFAILKNSIRSFRS